MDKTWLNRFKAGLFAAKVDLTAHLGGAHVNAGEIITLKKGDVITLDQFVAEPINIYVEGILKFKGKQVSYRGNQAVQVSRVISKEEVIDNGTE